MIDLSDEQKAFDILIRLKQMCGSVRTRRFSEPEMKVQLDIKKQVFKIQTMKVLLDLHNGIGERGKKSF